MNSLRSAKSIRRKGAEGGGGVLLLSCDKTHGVSINTLPSHAPIAPKTQEEMLIASPYALKKKKKSNLLQFHLMALPLFR